MASSDASFLIAHTLLDADMPWPAWTNLGCWQRPDGSLLSQYQDAARQLATRVGAAAITAPGQCIADLGCGHGASLLQWQQQFAAAHVIGIELQQSYVDSWLQLGQPIAGITLRQGRFDQLPLPENITTLLPPPGCDAVICVDAAYHADSLGAFAAVAQRLLRAHGRLAFTTVLQPVRTRLALRLRQRLMTRLSGIPSASFLSAADLQQTLTRLGFDDIGIEYLDHEVLQGFASFVTRRAAELPRAQRHTLAWLKIAATGALCGRWFQQQEAHYVLVSARRTG